MAFKSNTERLKPELNAHNTWGIGADDVMIVITFPEEWEVKHSNKFMKESASVYLDMSIEDALKFAENIIAAAKDAQRIDKEYSESQENNATLAQ